MVVIRRETTSIFVESSIQILLCIQKTYICPLKKGLFLWFQYSTFCEKRKGKICERKGVFQREHFIIALDFQERFPFFVVNTTDLLWL